LVCIFPVTSSIGCAAVEELLLRDSDAPVRVRAVVATESEKSEMEQKYVAYGERLQVIILTDMTNEEEVSQVFKGVDRAVIIPREDATVMDIAFKRAKQSGVIHTSLVSLNDHMAGSPIGMRFAEWEQTLIANSMNYTILRTSPMMDLLLQFAPSLKRPAAASTDLNSPPTAGTQVVHHWYGNGYFCPVHPHDVGVAVASVLIEGPTYYGNQTLTMYGPQSASFAHMCKELSNVLGYPIEPIADIDTPEKLKERLSGNYPGAVLDDMVLHQEMISKLDDRTPTRDLFQLIGPELTVRDFITENKTLFQ